MTLEEQRRAEQALHGGPDLVEQLKATMRQMQKLLIDLDKVLDFQAQPEEAAGLTTDDLNLLPQQ